MKELSLHIRYLLRHHDCVIVPEIGAFLAQEMPAQVDAERRLFLPPRRRVHFNPLIRTSDGLLAHSYARRAGVSYEEAAMHVADLGADLKSRLARGGQLPIEGVGILQGQPDGSLLFIPREASPWLPVALVAQQTAKQPAGPVMDKERYYYLRISKTFTQVAACILLVLATAFAVVVPNQQKIATLQQASIVSTLTNARQSLFSVENAVMPAQESVDEVAETPVEPMRYYLVVGATRTDQQLQDFLRQHQASAYSLDIVPAKGITKIYALAGNDRDALVQIMRSEAFKNEFGQCWIYEDKTFE